MADTPEDAAGEGDQVAMFGGLGRALGEVAGSLTPGIGQIIEAAPLIEVQRALGETLRNAEMLNGVQDLLHDLQDDVIQPVEGAAPAGEDVLDAGPPQELQAAAAAGGEVAAADADGADDAYDAAAEA